MFEVDAWWAKLADTSPLEEDGDVDFYGIYGTYKALEPVDISLYWTLVRDGRSLNDTNNAWFAEWIEDWLNLDDYDVTNLHTFGMRAWDASGGFDYDLELAYQTGDAGQVGSGFVPFTYGDDGAEYDAWAGEIEVGYTFDVAWQPRVCLGAAYFEGEDNRDLSFWDWVNPFDRPQASVSFNRMFSQSVHSWHLAIFQDLSNFYEFKAGVQVQPTETISANLMVAYLGAVDEFDSPVYFDLGRYRVPIAPALSFWTTPSDDELGWLAFSQVKYQYSEDIFVRFTWEHLFVGDGLEDGNFVGRNGMDLISGRDNDDADYFMLETGVKF